MHAHRYHWLWRWHVLLNVGLVLLGVLLAITWSRRALIVVGLVPLAFVPFSHTRLHLDRRIGESLRSVALFQLIVGAGVLLDLTMVAQLLTARTQGAAYAIHGPVLSWIGPIWFSSFAILALGRVLTSLGRAIKRTVAGSRSTASSSPPVDEGRRDFLRGAGMLSASAPFVLSTAGASTSYDFRLERHEIRLPHWPRQLDGLRVAHLSDIHVGGTMDLPRLLRVASLTNEAKPDLVLHTGDFLTHRPGDFDAPLYEALSRIKAPYGQWACLGNHDFDDPQRLVRRLGEVGVRTLRNRFAILTIDGEELEVAGLDYVSRRGDRAARVARAVEPWGPRERRPRILMNHDPTSFADLPDSCADLVCSGHTHGGQIGVQLGPRRALTVVGLVGIPDQGVYRRGDMTMFVTRCVGFYGYPMRIGIPPEVALLTLRTA